MPHRGTQVSQFKRPPGLRSWNNIIECLRTMGYHGLADKIHNKRVAPYLSFQQMPPSQQDTTCAVEGNSAKLEVVEIKDDKIDVVATEFHSLFQQCSSVKLKVELAFENSNVRLTHVTRLVQDQSGLALHPQATFDDVFRKLHTYCSVLNFGLIKFLVTELLPNDEALVKLVISFNDSIERFKKCVKMSQLAELIKDQEPKSMGTVGEQKKIAKLKVRKVWEDYTVRQFQEAAGKILRIIHGVMLLVAVESGCMCVTWIVPDEIDTDKLIQSKLSYEFVKIIGIIYLTIGDETIYRIEEPDGCETMEAAMLQAIELRNTQAIELFLSLGCNPAIATHSSTTTTVTNIVNIMIESVDCDERSSTAVGVNHICVLGRNSFVQAIANNYGPSVDSLSEVDTDITSGLGEETIDARLSELDVDGDLTSIEVIERYKIFTGQLWKEKICAEKKMSTEKEMKNKLCMELEQSKESQVALMKELKLIKERLSIYEREHLLEESGDDDDNDEPGAIFSSMDSDVAYTTSPTLRSHFPLFRKSEIVTGVATFDIDDYYERKKEFNSTGSTDDDLHVKIEKDELVINATTFLQPRISSDYFKFGHYLGIPTDVLQVIEESVGHIPERCVKNILLHWGKTSKNISSEAIANALEASGYPLLAAIANDQFKSTAALYCSVCKKPHGERKSDTESLSHILNSSRSTSLFGKEPDMAELSNFLVGHIPAKWELFGTQLGIEIPVMEDIRLNNPGDCKRCFLTLLDEWKKRCTRPYTWSTVITVLHSNSLREYLLAEKVYKFCMQGK